MTYAPTIPQGLPSPFSQVTQVQNNFADYATKFAVNHTALNATNQGAHEGVILTSQGVVDPDVTQDLVAFYCRDAISQLGTEPQLFFKIPKFLPTALDTTNAPNAAIQLTYNTVNTVGPIFQSFLPAGYLLFFGTVTDITINITLVPAPRQIIIAIANPNTMTTAGNPIPFDVSTQILSNDTFKINSNLNFGGPVIPYSFTWMAIAQA